MATDPPLPHDGSNSAPDVPGSASDPPSPAARRPFHLRLGARGEEAACAQLEASGYRILANHGRDAHQEVPHLHVHIFGKRPLGRMLAKDYSIRSRFADC